ncbi:MAG: transcriptional regulator, MarR family [Solirubrobacterales bacterium]|jgi:DNA-binding MarR family transcriptional regulator|nr:transcriptional regulator, MarR family [Solirubrobacterales bacterium]
MSTVEQPPSSSAPLDERELRAWRGLLRAHASLCKALDAELEAAHGLPLTTYEVLMYMHDAPSRKMRMCDLAECILLSRSGLTRLIDRLQRDGLVSRQSCSSDARGAYAVLTDDGARTLHEARATHLAGVRRLFLEKFTPEEQAMLGDAWERVLPGAGVPGGCGPADG